MSKKTIWDVFGGFLFLFCLSVMARSQGLQLPAPFIGTVEPEIVCVFGLLISTPCLILLTCFANRYRARRMLSPRYERIPPVFSDEDGAEARWLGWLAFALFPALAQLHFLRVFMLHGYVQRFTGEVIPGGLVSVLTSFRPIGVLFTDNYRYHHPHGVTVFPFWEPWFFLLLVCSALSYFAIYTVRLLRDPLPRPPSDLFI